MRAALVLAVLLLGGCDRTALEPPHGPATDATTGVVTARIVPRGEAEVTLRSGAMVPASLPPGFTLYPGAKIVANTLVERERVRHALLVFETADPVAKVMTFYRWQAEAADLRLTLDLAGEEQASIGGQLPSGRALVITSLRVNEVTRVEFSSD